MAVWQNSPDTKPEPGLRHLARCDGPGDGQLPRHNPEHQRAAYSRGGPGGGALSKKGRARGLEPRGPVVIGGPERDRQRRVRSRRGRGGDASTARGESDSQDERPPADFPRTCFQRILLPQARSVLHTGEMKVPSDSSRPRANLGEILIPHSSTKPHAFASMRCANPNS